jgi:UDP-4-amino-4,6-dideoxy-N-acetyl-beta-L-altrosamine transaminase
MMMAKEQLAIHGGMPVRATMLPYGRQSIDDQDIAAVVEVLQSDWLTTGPHVAKFEEAFADLVGAKYAVAVSNGTAALHAAAFAAAIKPGDEAIVTPMTFAASANCVRYQGGTVIFADVKRDTLNLDPARVAGVITPRTRVIVTVDYCGQPSDLDELNMLAKQHHLTIIEDAAHALGATYHGSRVGTLAHLTTFSLHPVKHITTGEGGIIVTNDPEMVERLRLFRNHGITSDHRQREATGSWYYEMVELGYNYRLTDFQCALGQAQLQKLPGWLTRRHKIAAKYNEAFAPMAEIEVPSVSPDRNPAWHLYVIRLNLSQLTVDRAEIFRALRAENIGVNVHYIPVPWHPYYQSLGYSKGQWPEAEKAYERIITLPIYPNMTDKDIGDVIEAVTKVVCYYRKS